MSNKPKKYLWLMSTLLPLMGLSGIVIFQFTGYSWALFIPLVFIYFFIPLLDVVFGNDDTNPTEDEVSELEKSNFYNWVLYLMLPIHFMVLFYTIHFMVTTQLAIWMDSIIIISMGIFGGLAVNLGHELGHKKSRIDKNLAKLALASGAYGHFNIEHNAGHHRQVATPEDSASARYGENIYQFALREMPGGLKRAWKIERLRLARKQLPWYSVENQILHSYLMTMVIYAALTFFFGWQALVILLLHAPIVWWQLTSANYIEHYGLLRQKIPSGDYEKCQPHHSWNSNHLISNLVLFHLQRHSDHHANPARHYQSLRHFEHVPQLPTGYMGMFLLAYIPPAWFMVMNKKVMQVYENDLSQANMA